MKKAIGKNTLGGGNKMNVDLRTYNRSTHNLSRAWRSTVGVGTLVPCFKQLALPGDVYNITIDAKVFTFPTLGPLFGSYKMQIDMFTCPIRLYISELHNNALNVGMNMASIKLPKLQMRNNTIANLKPTEANEFPQISPSCVLAYLGLRGWGIKSADNEVTIKNCVPLLSYLDIFKNYYANKQEENFYYLGGSTGLRTINTLAYQTVNNDRYILSPTSSALGQIRFVDKTITDLYEQSKSEELETYVKTLRFRWGSNYVRYAGSDELVPSKTKDVTYDEMLQWFKSAGIVQDMYELDVKSQEADTRTQIEIEGLGTRDLTFIEVVADSELALKSAPLTEIDDTREALLKSYGVEYTFTDAASNPSSYIKDLITGDENTPPITTRAGAGLLIKTHQSDLFNNWVNTEWIDGENGINSVTAIDTSAGSFTIDTLNLAKKVYDMLNRIAVSGGTYKDWIETVYTNDYVLHAETPIYEGGYSNEIVFQEVVSNSATDEQPLGTLAGRGILGDQKKGGNLTIKVNEPSNIIGIISLTPRVDYCQGNDWDMDLDNMDDLHKPQLDGIGFQDLTTNLMAWWKPNTESVGKTVAWINYMTDFNKTYGGFAKRNELSFMVLNRFYTPQGGTYTESAPIDYTTYINPEQFNYQFADTTADSQNFWIQIGFGVESRRVMSAKQIPNL